MKATIPAAQVFNLSDGLQVPIYYPQHDKELQELIAMAQNTGYKICPVGNVTKLPGFISPAKLKSGRYILVSMSKFNRILSYIPENLALTVEAGVTLTQILELTRPKRQFCPALLFQPVQATLGGTVASNQKHLLEQAYGSISNYIGGVELVSASGTLNFGGTNVKNVTGYEIGRFLAGSLGLYGIISKVTLFLKPFPDQDAYIIWNVDDTKTLFNKLAELKQKLFTLKGCWIWPEETRQKFNVLFALYGTANQVESEHKLIKQALAPGALSVAAAEIEEKLFHLNREKQQARAVIWDRQQAVEVVNRHDFVLYDYLSGEVFTNSFPSSGIPGIELDDTVTLIRLLKARLDPAQVFIGDEFYA
jgi:FAD/FMN-containing dehydrogenase